MGLLLAHASHGQTYDSLKAALPFATDTLSRLELLNEMTKAGVEDGVPGVLSYAHQGLQMAQLLGGEQEAWSWYLLGTVYPLHPLIKDSTEIAWEQAWQYYDTARVVPHSGVVARDWSQYLLSRGRLQESLEVASWGYRVADRLQDEPLQADMLCLLCELNSSLGYLGVGTNYCTLALAKNQDLGNEGNKVRIYAGMSRIFRQLQDLYTTQQLLEEGVVLAEGLAATLLQADIMVELGELALLQNERDAASMMFTTAVGIYEEAQHSRGRARAYCGLGEVARRQGYLRSAERDLSVALSYATEIKDRQLMVKAFASLGLCYQQMELLDRGRNQMLQAVQLAREINTLPSLYDAYHAAGEFYVRTDQKDSAIYFMREYMEVQEKFYATQLNRQLADALVRFELQEKELEVAALQSQLVNQEQVEVNRQIQIFALIAGIVAVILITLVLFSRYSVKLRATEALHAQTESINRQKEEILAQRNEIEQKNRLLQTKNREIIESIEYARNIQLAMLPEEALLRESFPESFLFSIPQDIVSGDIFWHGRLDDLVVMALVDCTGNGVPGAFMTVLANNLLNQLVLEQQLKNPAEIVAQLDKKVKAAVRQDDLNSITNGLDISLIVVDLQTRWMEFTGAKMSLYYVHNYSLVQIKGDRYSVGSIDQQEKYFTRQRIKLHEGDYIYLASDGFQNQFGGKDGKKYMKTQFRRLLSSLSTLPMSSQKDVLDQRFFAWKGDYPQTDDVLVVGMQV